MIEWVVILPILISVMTFIYTLISGNRKADNDYTTKLETRVKDLEDRMLKCEQARENLANENSVLIKERVLLLEKVANIVPVPITLTAEQKRR